MNKFGWGNFKLRVTSAVAVLVACVLAAPPSSASPAGRHLQSRHHTAGLGPVLQSALGGEIFGWDIDQSGNDGLLSESVINGARVTSAIETFDLTTAKVTKVVRKIVTNASTDYMVLAIAGNDVGLIDEQHDYFKGSRVVRHDRFLAMNPVSGGKITGNFDPPHRRDIVPSYMSDNQGSSSELMSANFSKSFRPELLMYDTATNAWGKRFTFPHEQLVGDLFPEYVAVDSETNQAVAGYHPSQEGQYGPPSFDVININTGNYYSFGGVFGAGMVEGMAIDSTTGVMCATSQNMSVLFFNLATGVGFSVLIPGNGGALTGGASVAVDQIHHLFFVAQINSTFTNGGSTVIVYDEKGNLLEPINGFAFDNPFSVIVPRVAVNSALRIGYATGPGSTLQSFTY